jgi:hypothetical protein
VKIITIAFTVLLAFVATVVWAFLRFFLGPVEVLVVLGFALIVLVAVGRGMKREGNPASHFARIGQGIIGVFMVLSLWGSRGPSKERLLERPAPELSLLTVITGWCFIRGHDQ